MIKNKETEEPPRKKTRVLFNFFKKKICTLFFNIKKKEKRNDLVKEIIKFFDKNQKDFLEDNTGEFQETNQMNALQTIKDLILFYKIILDEIKIPRNKIVSISQEEILKIFDIFKEKKISNIIVYEKNLDNILGFINIKDLFLLKINNTECLDNYDDNFKEKFTTDLKKLIKKPLFVPPTMRASNLLSKMKTEHIHVAVLIDEYGGTDGIVTINDIISEIIGEISEENDKKSLFFNYKSDESFEVNPLIEIDILEEKIGQINFFNFDNIETLNGLIISIFNQIPEINTEIMLNQDFICKILEIDERRIQRVLIQKINIKNED